MFIALSLAFPYMFGLGCLVLVPYYRRYVILQQTKDDANRAIATLLMAGILLNHLLVSIMGRLDRSMLLGSSLSCAGFWLAFRARRSDLKMVGPLNRLAILLVLCFAVLYAVPVLSDPISSWDARSIWFFHAKMIYYNQAFSPAAGWNIPSVQFSHVDYPKLVPIMAAQFTFAAGYWNGYMDGYMALYAALSALFLGRWLDDNDPLDMIAGITCLGIIGNLKNEGLLYILTITACIAAIMYVRRKNAPALARHMRSAWPLILFIALGISLWYGLKWKWGISSDNFIQLNQIPARLENGSPVIIMALCDAAGRACFWTIPSGSSHCKDTSNYHKPLCMAPYPYLAVIFFRNDHCLLRHIAKIVLASYNKRFPYHAAGTFRDLCRDVCPPQEN